MTIPHESAISEHQLPMRPRRYRLIMGDHKNGHPLGVKSLKKSEDIPTAL
jgi:hypothetical protein